LFREGLCDKPLPERGCARQLVQGLHHDADVFDVGDVAPGGRVGVLGGYLRVPERLVTCGVCPRATVRRVVATADLAEVTATHHHPGNGKKTSTSTTIQPTTIHQVELTPPRSVRRRGLGLR
jgi:hypothetical protein